MIKWTVKRPCVCDLCVCFRLLLLGPTPDMKRAAGAISLHSTNSTASACSLMTGNVWRGRYYCVNIHTWNLVVKGIYVFEFLKV